MEEKQNRNVHLLRQEDPAEDAINEMMEEIREENDLLDEVESRIRHHKIRFIRRIVIAVIVLLMILLGSYVFVTRQTYNRVRILDTYANSADSGEQYVPFANGILRYSRDGVSLVNKKGKEQWNASYQISNPIVSVKGNSAAIADKAGNDIVVFQKKGLKGEIHTNLPIEKIVVSAQGIVSAVLKDEVSSKIVCYDAAGNILVEHKTSAMSTGYPIDLDISDNGCVLLVSYLVVEDGTLSSKVAYYNFGEEGQNKDNYLVTEDNYKDVIIPSVFFLDNNTSAVVADNKFIIYKGKQVPQKTETVDFENGIKSVFHSDKYIGIVSQNKTGKGNIVKLYDNAGKQVLAEAFEGEYKNIKISGNQILMYDGKNCTIFAKSGVCKFEGEFEEDILEIIPLIGINKYLVINANGLEKVGLAK